MSQPVDPKAIWHYFGEITRIPRPSKKEIKMIEYLKRFATEQGLELKTDRVGNILITKPASKGYESAPTTVLQSHIDMVCEKNNDVIFDFENDPIQTYTEGEWLRAKGTTLGADNGIGVAAQLALLADKSLEHGSLECLFTVDEETGLTGAYALESGFFTGKTLINLDSEDIEEVFIGCAGGIDTTARLPYQMLPTPEGLYFFQVEIKGLQGGHSGCDIHKGLANANKLMANYLLRIAQETDLYLSELRGGNLRNAIAREAKGVAAVPFEQKERVRVLLNIYAAEMTKAFSHSEQTLAFELESCEAPTHIIEPQTSNALIRALVDCPHGVIAMSPTLKGLVETSTNLAALKMKTETQEFEIITSQRSSVEPQKRAIAQQVENVLAQSGAVVTHGDGYPGWQPNVNSAILRTTKEIYLRLFGKEPQVKAIHAGLECGLFSEKYPGLDMVSIGPTIEGAHSPDERIQISTVQQFWELLTEILKHRL